MNHSCVKHLNKGQETMYILVFSWYTRSTHVWSKPRFASNNKSACINSDNVKRMAKHKSF